MLDFLKTLAERLRMELLLAALAIAILLFKIFDFDAWWMFFAFCVAYMIHYKDSKEISDMFYGRYYTKGQII